MRRLRRENLAELRGLNLRPEDLERRGRHPALGVVTLSELLATWAAHDLTHLHQISRIMAHQYREAVGPWSAYLGVLQCAGHSASAVLVRCCQISGSTGSAEAEVFFAEMEGLFAGVADGFARVGGCGMAEIVDDAVGDEGELRS